jgi:hypothetical protein
MRRKTIFDRKVKKHPGEVIFATGQLVQVYRSDLDNTFKAERKLLPKWSQPHRIKLRLRNSYKLETIGGDEIEGEFNARRLRAFIPREGTRLAEEQRAFDEKSREEDKRRADEEERAIADERREEGVPVAEDMGLEGEDGQRDPDRQLATRTPLVFSGGAHVVGGPGQS